MFPAEQLPPGDGHFAISLFLRHEVAASSWQRRRDAVCGRLAVHAGAGQGHVLSPEGVGEK